MHCSPHEGCERIERAHLSAEGPVAVDTIPHRLLAQAEANPNRPAYYVRSTSGNWEPTSWGDYADNVRTAANALIALGIEAGETTTLLGFNCPQWTIFDVASMCIGAAPAGIYTTCSPEEVAYIINHSEARIILVEDADQWAKVQTERDAGNLEKLEHGVLMYGSIDDDDMVMSWEEFLAHAEQADEGELESRMEALEADQLATLIYTSGTTGPPKGVMLSHNNLAWTAACARDLFETNPDDSSLSYLPLSHIAEQMFTIHVPATIGSQVYYARSIEQVPDDLKEVQPTVMFGVPRIWEKFHAGISAKLADAPPIKGKLVDWAMGVGLRVFEKFKRHGREPSGWLGMQYKLANKLIYSKLKPAIGLGNARVCVSGAAPISREILEFFAGLDIVILEVYGQSEDTGPTSFNRPDRIKLGSVGPVLPGVDVQIADDGEILVKGPNVFLGYYKDEEATNETLIDGYLHSGDIGQFDDEGFLHITGRKKEIIITAGGKNVTPKNIEAALKNDGLITEAVVIGDRRKFLSALVCLDPEACERFGKEHGISADEVPGSDAAEAHVQNVVDEMNQRFARVEQIKKFTILPRPLSVEEGELTPTLKVKRRIVNDHFEDEIEAMYAD